MEIENIIVAAICGCIAGIIFVIFNPLMQKLYEKADNYILLHLDEKQKKIYILSSFVFYVIMVIIGVAVLMKSLLIVL
ncbi:hypothetical protein H8S37_04095 [Mediterraneibacter sp. NSJ-55]|uniref:Uncharacterized protein n=1 Tax=Mediterraneibacter hominis TaxID=2763054 RepID=A0A923LH00_9FIRM|nr:hypothetical protein [Mediterraneibacter hominis]MBC5688114.1 hypothetical protein [Mediterraneibacter hominis]